MTLMHVAGVFTDGGWHIRIYAACFGVPLVCAVIFACFIKTPALRFSGSNLLDPIAMLMSAYWCFETAHGYINANNVNYLVSTSFNFQVPALVYFSMRKLSHQQVLSELRKSLDTTCRFVVPFSILVTLYALSTGWVGAGGTLHLLPISAGLFALSQGRAVSGTYILFLASAAIVASLKRAVWGGLILLSLIFIALHPKIAHRMGSLLICMVTTACILALVQGALPESLSVSSIMNRAYSAVSETNGFENGQARQDEYEGIVSAVFDDRSDWKAFCGLGMGATYTYHTLRTHNELYANHHDSHFTPAAWLLRGGYCGVVINSVFYLAACYCCLVACRLATSNCDRAWHAAYTAYFLVAVLQSAAAFSLTPSAATHIALMAVVLPRRAATSTITSSRSGSR